MDGWFHMKFPFDKKTIFKGRLTGKARLGLINVVCIFPKEMKRWKSFLQNLGHKKIRKANGVQAFDRSNLASITSLSLLICEASNLRISCEDSPNLPWQTAATLRSLTGKKPPGTPMVGLRKAGNCRNFLRKYCCVFRKSGVGRVHPPKTNIYLKMYLLLSTSDFLLPCLFSGGGGYSSSHNNGSGNEAAEDGFSLQTCHLHLVSTSILGKKNNHWSKLLLFALS